MLESMYARKYRINEDFIGDISYQHAQYRAIRWEVHQWYICVWFHKMATNTFESYQMTCSIWGHLGINVEYDQVTMRCFCYSLDLLDPRWRYV